MRPIYLGLALFLVGLCSTILLYVVADWVKFCLVCPGGIPHPDVWGVDASGHPIPCRGKPPPAFYIGLIDAAKVVTLFSLPLGIAIEARLFLKEK
jgi:hypothetical protein